MSLEEVFEGLVPPLKAPTLPLRMVPGRSSHEELKRFLSAWTDGVSFLGGAGGVVLASSQHSAGLSPLRWPLPQGWVRSAQESA